MHCLPYVSAKATGQRLIGRIDEMMGWVGGSLPVGVAPHDNVEQRLRSGSAICDAQFQQQTPIACRFDPIVGLYPE